MALTQAKEQRLEKVGLVAYFVANQPYWKDAAKKTLLYLRGNFPANSTVRPDDVAKPLFALVEVDEALQVKLSTDKLTQAYYKKDFTDLIIDRVWVSIQ